MNREDLKEEYKILSNLEMETAKIRYATFTAILSVSFVLPGLYFSRSLENSYNSNIDVCVFKIHISELLFLLGFILYLFALFYYWWFHRYSHIYRKRLKELEKKLGWNIYSLRKRPTVKNMKFHFAWTLYSIGIIYGLITFRVVGSLPFSLTLGVLILFYLFPLFFSKFRKEEPLEY